MDEKTHTTRRSSLLRLIAAGLAGAFGAFAVPVLAHRPAPRQGLAAPSAVHARDVTPD